MEKSTIELITFKSKKGVTRDEIAIAGSALSEFLNQQPGLLYRSLSEDDDGLWHDILYWKTMDNAKAASDNFMKHPAGMAMMELVDSNSTQMRHMSAISEVMGETSQ